MLAYQVTALIALSFLTLLLLVLHLQKRKGLQMPLGCSSLLVFGLGAFMAESIAGIIAPVYVLAPLQIENTLLTFAWFALAYTVNAGIKRFVYRRRLTEEGDPRVPLIIQYLVSTLIYLAAVMLIVSLVFEQSVFGIAATSGAVALVLGYSARTVLEEMFAGSALNFSSPFEKGDLIQLNEEWALVKDIDWRSITYIDMDNNFVVVPNTVVAASKIRNLDRPDGVTRRLVYFLVEYNSPPKEVIDSAMQAMAECPHILDHEWNEVCVWGYDNTGIRYRAAFHIKSYWDWWSSSNEFTNALWYRFKRRGIRFGEQRSLNFISPEDSERTLPDSLLEVNNWRMLVERFEEVPMFDAMTREDMMELAKSAVLRVVGPPERIIRAGSKRTSMFLIASGEADVFEVDEQGLETKMASVTSGETVGLMSLLTGVSQRTTIRACVETAVWEISADSLHEVFAQNPEVMQQIADSVTQWQAEEEHVLNQIKLSRAQEKQILAKRATSLSNRISRFFDRRKSASGGSDTSSSEGFTDY